MMLTVVVLHPLQLPAGRDLSGPHITKGITMKGFLATGLPLLKSNKEYVLIFKILAQVLVGFIFTTLAN
jgi:hypothetical protein